MSIEKKSLISNRAATKKANLTKVNAAAQVSTTKIHTTPVRGLKVNATAVTGLKVTVSAVRSTHSKVVVR